MKDTVFTITYADLAPEGRAGKLVYGEQVTPYSLLFPLLIESSNDAGEAIKRFLGTEFDTSLHDIETELALTETHIVDGSGLSAQNTSSPHDLARLYAYLKKTHPHILDITQLDTYIGPRTGYVNNDPAHSLPNFVGGKHGYTPEAGKTFVGSFIVPDSKREVGIVLLGSNDLLSDIEKLLASDIMAQ
jgi:D-alanyl-D-alanine carboxypeptidase